MPTRLYLNPVAVTGRHCALDSALPDLSPRQREALLTAVETGYYRIPRDATTDDVAARLGVERRTAEEHLRRAENKLLSALAGVL